MKLIGAKVADPTRTPYDISRIDFERLQQEFARAEKQQETFDLKERIENRLARMLRANPKRVDLYEKYQGIIRKRHFRCVDFPASKIYRTDFWR